MILQKPESVTGCIGDIFFSVLFHQLLVPWLVPEIFTGHYIPAKMLKISTLVPLECYYWLTELIHVSS